MTGLLFVLVSAFLAQEPTLDLSVLYVHDEYRIDAESGERRPNDRVSVGRARAFEAFLARHFESVRAVSHGEYHAGLLDPVDVVVLDWHQTGTLDIGAGPLGDREDWETPTVLLGSAGLNVARAWRVRGASG